jgi:L-amino acid N-acyltransferase YncA
MNSLKQNNFPVSEVTIRSYQPADRSQCLEIFKGNVPRFFTTAEIAEFEVWLNGQDEEHVAYGNVSAQYYFVVESGNKIIGCGGFYIAREEATARMAWGMVANALHKKGVGKKLLEHRINVIGALHPDCSISLDTTQHSFGFFEKLGFITTKITRDFYAPGMDRYDMVKG